MGLTVLDAGVLIGFLDADDAHHQAAHESLGEARKRHDELVVPASAYAEILVGPSRRGAEAVATVRELVRRVPLDVAPLDPDTAVLAAGIRARHPSLKLPDALVIATAASLKASRLVTTDRRWPTRAQLRLQGTTIEILPTVPTGPAPTVGAFVIVRAASAAHSS